MDIQVELSGMMQRLSQLSRNLPVSMDRYAMRAANEFARTEKTEVPKGLSVLANSVQVTRNGMADFSAGPTVRYAAAVNDGGRPHWAPAAPLMDWLRTVKRVSDPVELAIRTRGLQRHIAAHGTKANPFVRRTREKMEARVISLMNAGVQTALEAGEA